MVVLLVEDFVAFCLEGFYHLFPTLSIVIGTIDGSYLREDENGVVLGPAPDDVLDLRV